MLLFVLLDNYAKGIAFLTLAATPGVTDLSCPIARFCLMDFALRRWRLPGLLRSTLPEAVILKRLTMDFFVFCISRFVRKLKPDIEYEKFFL
jgi:hypothetical protein